MMWRIELFGGLTARRGDIVINRFNTRKTGELLGFLAVYAGREFSRHELGSAIWPESDDSDAVKNRLRNALSSLRRQLEPPGIESGSVLVSARDTISLNRQVVHTDLIEFKHQVALARSSDVNQLSAPTARALDLYGGALLSGYEGDWVYLEQRVIELDLLHMARQVSEPMVGEQVPASVRSRLLKIALSIEPYDARWAELLVQTLANGGSTKEGLDILRAFRKRLEQDLGDSIPADLANLESCLVSALKSPSASKTNGDPLLRSQPASIASSRFPIPPTRFFGREAELANLRRLLVDEKSRLVTVVGPGGSGKTRLSLQLASSLAPEGVNETWFVPLADLDDGDKIADAILEAICGTSSVEGHGTNSVVEALSHYAKPLLVLDNFEHLIEQGADIAHSLLRKIPTLQLLITSRHMLQLEGEQIMALGLLPTPTSDEMNPEDLGKIASVQLFLDRARLAKADFQVTTRNCQTISRLAMRLEGIPLAIELCAALASTTTPFQMLHSLDERFGLLKSRRRDIPARHRTLHAAIQYSTDRLLDSMAQSFFRLSVFRGGWSRDAASALLGVDNSDQLVLELQDRSLVTPVVVWIGQDEHVRFTMLETIRDFAKSELPESERIPLADRHAKWFSDFAHRENERAKSGDASAFERIEADYANICTALDHLIETARFDDALDLCNDLYRMWASRSEAEDGYQRFDSILSNSGSLDAPLRLRCLAAQNQAGLAGRIEDAAKLLHSATRYLVLAEELQDDGRIAAAFNLVALQRVYIGAPHDATSFFLKGLVHAKKAGSIAHEATLTCNLGIAWMDTGERQRAWNAFEKSIDLSLEVKEYSYACVSCANLAALAITEDKLEAAGRFLEQGRALADQIGHLIIQRSLAAEAARMELKRKNWQTCVQAIQFCLSGATRETTTIALICAAVVFDEWNEPRAAATSLGAADRMLSEDQSPTSFLVRYPELVDARATIMDQWSDDSADAYRAGREMSRMATCRATQERLEALTSRLAANPR
ncbi:MAG: BTAD domain-containing putative transcriptional regulator [Fimbriimonas sp.]|nr:BTAD domain-containing putative transcriptional regulator [Fimbriimonas sp.]